MMDLEKVLAITVFPVVGIVIAVFFYEHLKEASKPLQPLRPDWRLWVLRSAQIVFIGFVQFWITGAFTYAAGPEQPLFSIAFVISALLFPIWLKVAQRAGYFLLPDELKPLSPTKPESEA